MTSLIIHGHFYQPPRENPWTGEVDVEPTATPFHDWNERIHAECYQPNSNVRLIDPNSGNQRVVNNYELVNFDFGPTLLSWLERHHTETYQRILAADATSLKLHNGHGNAIAQAYSHAILPLCNDRDRRTQVRWGIADFRHRFGRQPESIWPPETACNDDVLDLLIEEGMRFVILAPQQAAFIRNSDAGLNDWQPVTPESLDPSIAYRYSHRDQSPRSIAVFFYDSNVAEAIAFGRALDSSSELVHRFTTARSSREMVNVATDGESYGHHHKFGELCLAYALEIDAPNRGFQITNYGEYLDSHPASAEIRISSGSAGEGSSWSCVHGVTRWRGDCGCHTGGNEGWNQAWRAPLRKALDYLRDAAAVYFEATRGELFDDPWLARDESIELWLNQSSGDFLSCHAPRTLTSAEENQAYLHLEMQRNLLLMYASCGWFFSDISGIEPVQIMKYAARAIDLMDQLNLPSPRTQFVEILSEAKSNRSEMGNGADIYRDVVESSNPAAGTLVDQPTRTFA
jgi:alpha-amylase/alpha-mannosidase (GH57 family)